MNKNAYGKYQFSTSIILLSIKQLPQLQVGLIQTLHLAFLRFHQVSRFIPQVFQSSLHVQ
jgi:hypothetical protein